MYALIDCNNFFVSCERTLDKSLINRPVVVLSNGDSCVVSRSEEAKAIGIPMGAPVFKFQQLFAKNDVKMLSAKFELYNYKSQQVMEVARNYAPDYEIYSIDELFLDFNGFQYFNLEDYSKKIKTEILQQSEIPTTIGIAPTKTLCKIASRIAKKFPERLDGIYCLDTPEKIEKALRWIKIEDVWGIGRRYAAKMHENGIYKASDLLQKPEQWIRKTMGINGIRMINELKAIPQLELDNTLQTKKSIATTRSFTTMISTKTDLQERVETFSFYCAERLRKQKSCCKTITVFVRTNRFRKDLPEYCNTLFVNLDNPTNSSILIAKEASKLLDQIYRDGYFYKKAGVIVSDFVPENQRITSLYENDMQNKHLPIMTAMDYLNKKYGKDKIRIGGMSGKNTFERKIFSTEYQKFLQNNILPEANYRFH